MGVWRFQGGRVGASLSNVAVNGCLLVQRSPRNRRDELLRENRPPQVYRTPEQHGTSFGLAHVVCASLYSQPALILQLHSPL